MVTSDSIFERNNKWKGVMDFLHYLRSSTLESSKIMWIQHMHVVYGSNWLRVGLGMKKGFTEQRGEGGEFPFFDCSWLDWIHLEQEPLEFLPTSEFECLWEVVVVSFSVTWKRWWGKEIKDSKVFFIKRPHI
jgi:hypothetical protein